MWMAWVACMSAFPSQVARPLCSLQQEVPSPRTLPLQGATGDPRWSSQISLDIFRAGMHNIVRLVVQHLPFRCRGQVWVTTRATTTSPTVAQLTPSCQPHGHRPRRRPGAPSSTCVWQRVSPPKDRLLMEMVAHQASGEVYFPCQGLVGCSVCTWCGAVAVRISVREVHIV